jgi:hypothetical protein
MDQGVVLSSKPASSGWKGTGVDFKTWPVWHLKVAPKRAYSLAGHAGSLRWLWASAGCPYLVFQYTCKNLKLRNKHR